MRGQRVEGRFGIDFEALSIYEGIADELGTPVGQRVAWWVWDQEHLEENYDDVVDPIYDVGLASTVAAPNRGRRWKTPLDVPVVMAQVIRGSNVQNERGFYVTDTLRVVVNARDLRSRISDILDKPDEHIKDRLVYRNQVFVPTRVLPRGHFGSRYAVVTVDCDEVAPEQLINDVQFQQYALQAPTDFRNPPVTP